MFGVCGPGTHRVWQKSLAPILHLTLGCPRLRSRAVTLPVGQLGWWCPFAAAQYFLAWAAGLCTYGWWWWFACVHLPLRGFHMASAHLLSGCFHSPRWLVSCLDLALIEGSGSAEVGQVCLDFVPCPLNWLAWVLVWCTLR